MARPQDSGNSSRPNYFGGTPTSPTGYDRPTGQQDPGYAQAPAYGALDFSDGAIRQRELEQRNQAIANLRDARALYQEAGPTGWVAPGALPPEYQDTAPAGLVSSAYRAYVMSLDTRASNLLQYPSLASAALQADIDERDFARLVNYAEADSAAERVIGSLALVYNEEKNEDKANLGRYQINNILRSANPVMQAAIWDVVATKIAELEAPEGTDSSAWVDGVMQWVGTALDTLFTPLIAANEAVQRGFRAGMYGSQVEESQGFAPVGVIQNIFEYWDKVEQGNYDQNLLTAAKQEYGRAPVDLVLAVEQKTREGDPEPLVSLFAEMSDDPEAMAIIADMLYGDGSSGVDINEVSRAVDNAALGNTGQLFWSGVLGTTGMGSDTRANVANATNILATIALDPTIMAGKVRASYIAVRFAMEKVAPGATRAGIEAALQMGPTKRYFNALFKDLDRYDELLKTNPGAAATLREQIRRQFAEIPDDTIDVLREAGVRNIDDLTEWTVETNAMYLMAKGRVPTGMISAGDDAVDAVQPLAVAMAERGAALSRAAVLPRMSYAKRARERMARATGRVMPSTRGQTIINDVYDNTSDPAAFVDTINDVANVQRAGQMERGGITVRGSMGKRIDTVFKYFSSIGVGHVNIVDGRDAKLIYRYARSFLSRRHATYWADQWRRANPGQRYDMLVGLNRTAAAAKGINLSDPAMLSRVDEMVRATATNTSFAAKSRPLSLTPKTVNDRIINSYGPGVSAADAAAENTRRVELMLQNHPDLFIAREGGKRTRANVRSGDLGDYYIDPAKKDEYVQKYLDEFLPGVDRNDTVILYKGLTEAGNGLPFGVAKTSDDQLDVFGDLGATQLGSARESYWTLDPNVARIFATGYQNVGTGKIAKIEMTWGEYLEYQVTMSKAKRVLPDDPVNDMIAAADSAPAEWIVKLNYRNIPDSWKQRVAIVDADSIGAAQSVADDLVDPSDFGGVSKALFGWQTASHVALPSMRDMDKLGRWQRFVSQGGTLGEAVLATPQTVTDAWSLGTLFGLRFSLRSAIEDWWFYAVITGGNLKNLYKGRRISTMLRETRGRSRTTAFSKKDVSALGMFNRRLRAVGDTFAEREGAVANVMGRWIQGNLDPVEVNIAYQAAKKGDFDPMRRLAGVAMARSRLSTLSPVEKEYVLDLMDGPFGLKILDDLAETGKNLNNGGLLDDAVVAGTNIEGVSVGAVPRGAEEARRFPVGDYTPELPVDPILPESFMYWDRGINGVLLGDGPAGRIAVAHLDDPDEAIRLIAQEIREDPTGYGYAWRFAALQTESPEVFAARKVQAVRGLFSDSQGNLNESLWRRVVDPDGNVSAFETLEDGTKAFKIDIAYLRSLPASQRPTFVSGQKWAEIPVPDGLGAFMDRSWTWMGEQYARISREPIYLANYLAHRKQLAGMESQLAGEIGEKAARRTVSRMAEDRAYAFTLAYMDNPQNRSLLAYKIRNVSRYYRATEDFYRRVARAGKNYPVGLWKTALIYDVLDDTGFVYTNEDGEKYFIYPGTKELMSGMNHALGLISGQDTDLGMAFPFVLGGKVTMLAPSTDPNQAFASMSGPLGAVSWRLLSRRFPTLSRLNRVVLGEYGVRPTSGVVEDITASFFPAGLQKVISTLGEDEADSMYGAAAKDAMVIAVANGLIPENPEDQNTPEYANAMAKINLIAWSAVITRFALGMIVPASPQRFNDNVSEYARKNGVVGLRPAFLSLIQKHADAGDENPVGTALVDWWRLDQTLMPYTVSKTEEFDGSIRGTAPLKTAKSVVDWYNSNTDLISKYPQTAYFLAPQDEGFDWSTWGLIMAEGLRTPKGMTNPDGSPGPFLRDLFAAKGEFYHYATIADYQRDIDALDARDPEQYKQIKELEKQRTADLQYVRNTNPYWDLKFAQTRDQDADQAVAEDSLVATKRMVDELYETTPKEEWDNSAAQAIRNSIYTYLDYATEIKMTNGTDNQSELKRRYLRIDLERDLNALADRNPNAKLFIRNVLMTDPDLGAMDLDLVGATSG